MKNETPRRRRTRAHNFFSHLFRRAHAPKLALACLCLLAAARAGHAQAGALDSSFDTDGRVVTNFGPAPDGANAVALQPDGKIILAGFSTNTSEDFAVARYNPDGSLDMTFGPGGSVSTDFVGLHDRAFAVRVQYDGKIVVAGYASGGETATNPTFALARYTTTGALDPSFDADGRVTTDLLGIEEFHALTIQPDGKIVAAGFSRKANVSDFVVARYNTDGSLDATFGANGLSYPFGRGGDVDDTRAFAVRYQPDGKIVVAGQRKMPGDNLDFAVARLNPDGSLDTTFGAGGPEGDGAETYPVSAAGDDIARAVDLQADGRIVVAGSAANGGGSDLALLRLEPSGVVDESFGTGGRVTTDVGGQLRANGVAVQPDGRIVAAGSGGTPPMEGFVLARFQVDGTPDATFGHNGGLVTDGFDGGANAVVLQPDGRIVVAGTTAGEDSAFAAARLFAGTFIVVNSNADTVDPDDGVTTLREAITLANDDPSLDTIRFDIDPLNAHPPTPGVVCPELTINGTASRVCRITPTESNLPTLTQPAIVDGYSQPGAALNTRPLVGADSGSNARILIELSGVASGADNGLRFRGGGVVRGVSFIGFSHVAVSLDGDVNNQEADYPGNRVEGCFFGLRPDGSATAAGRNLEAGVQIFGSDYSVVGTNLDASLDQTEYNVISNNTVGVQLRDINISEINEDTRGNRIQGNYVGLAPNGTDARGNISAGIELLSSGLMNENFVGHVYTEAANVVSGNQSDGIRLAAEVNEFGNVSGGPGGNILRGNVVGSQANIDVRAFFDSGTLPTPRPNTSHGIRLVGAGGTIIGAGEHGAAGANIVANNGGDGVRVEALALFGTDPVETIGANNRVLMNAIFDNMRLGINLVGGMEDANGVTANDGDNPATEDVFDPDSDTGANNLQNFPFILGASNEATATGTFIRGELMSMPEQTYRIEFFSNAACDSSGYGEGQVFLGAQTITTLMNGSGEFAFITPSPVPEGRFITATASHVTSDTPTFETSEFSACRVVTQEEEENAAPVVDAGPDHTTTEGETFDLTATFTDADASDTHTATINWGDRSPTEAGTVNEPAGGNPGTVRGSHVYNAPGTYTVTVTVMDSAGNSGSDTLTVTVNAACTPSNVALATAGARASASSVYPGRDYSPSGAINGDRRGLNWEAGGGWNDATRSVWPDWLQVAFDGPRTITEVRVYMLQNDFRNPVEPDANTPANLYGLIDFDVQYWDGQAWLTVPGGEVRGNDKAMRVVAFPQLTTRMIRVHVLNARAYFSRVTEVEAFGCPAPPGSLRGTSRR